MQLATGDLTSATATELAQRLASGEWSAREVVKAYWQRIEAVNPRLNALVVPLLEQAWGAAARADAARERGDQLGPLHGVPVTIKEMFDVAGTPTTAGMQARAGVPVAADAPLVARLRRAGAIVLGKTNVPQAGMMFETDNPVYGRTSNPWDPARAPGGSSGGEAALLAAGGSPLGLGSDGGGSIRYPCHCCGVCGLKPTAGRLPMQGHWSIPNFREEWVQPGPMARTVADLHLVLTVLATPTETEPCATPPLGDPARVILPTLRIGMYTDDGFFTPSPALRRAVHEAAAALRQRGACVEEFQVPDILEAERIYFGLFYFDGLDALRREIGRGRCDWRIRRFTYFGRMPDLLRPLCRAVLAAGGRRYETRVFTWARKRRLTAADLAELERDWAAYRQRFLAELESRRLDALIAPPNGLPALTHGAYYCTVTGSYTLLYNLLGLPAGVVPATRVRPGEESDRPPSKDPVIREARAVEQGSAGLPVGVQVVARPWREDVALAVMGALEQSFQTAPDYPRLPAVARRF